MAMTIYKNPLRFYQLNTAIEVYKLFTVVLLSDYRNLLKLKSYHFVQKMGVEAFVFQ